jgi:hypothetical protein
MTYRERIGALVTAVALATGLASGSTHGAVKRTAAQKCAAAKRKLVGKEAAALTKCDAAAVTMGVAVDPTCETRAKTAFTAPSSRSGAVSAARTGSSTPCSALPRMAMAPFTPPTSIIASRSSRVRSAIGFGCAR